MGKFDPNANKELPTALAPRPEYEVIEGDFLLSRANTAELVARSVVAKQVPPRLMLSDKIIRLRLARAVDREYVNLCNNSRMARDYYGAKASGTSSSMKNVSREVVLGLPIALPPLAEQVRIVARVDELMRLCDALEAKGRLEAAQHVQLLNTLLGTLTDSGSAEELAANWQRVATHFDLLLDRPEAVDELEQTILQLAVRGLLVPQDPREVSASAALQRIQEEKKSVLAEGRASSRTSTMSGTDDGPPSTLPPGWAATRLEDVCIEVVDCPHSTPKFTEHGTLCIDTNSFKGGRLLPHKLRYVDEQTYTGRITRLQPRPGDLVFAREGSVGESVLIPDGTKACLGQRVMLFRFSKSVSNEFMQLTITSPGFVRSLLELHKGIGAKHVNVGDMRRASIGLPPFDEQQRIVARVDRLRRLCADLRQRLAKAQATQSRLAEALVESATE